MTVDLDANLNFVGIFVPQDALKIFEELFNATDQLIISGPILLTGDQNPPPLPNKINNFPWESSNPAIAGITLKADLGITPDLSSKLQLSDTYYWIFSPLTTTFWESNSDTLTYAPFTAFTSKLLIPSAGKTIPLESKMMKGLPQLVITAEFDETFSDLAELIDLAGTADLKTLLPAEIQSNLGQLALRDAAISFSHTAGTVGLNIQYVYLTIGMTVTPPWKTEDEAFEFDSIEAAFIVTDPFGTPTPSVVVNGEFKIDGVPVDISAGYPDFFITGNLAASQSLDLTNFMSEYLPGVTPPSPLTINSLDINIEPDVSYNFYTQMASDPPWDIPLGKSGLTISDVSFGFAKTFGATDYSGQFQGTLQYGDLETLYMNFTLPGSFEIRADFENVTLSGLIDWLVDSDDILPTGFDLTFVESVILITGDPPNYQLYFGTQVADFGSLCFVLKDQDGSWGFAVGVDVQVAQLDQIPGLIGLKEFVDDFPFNDMVIAASTFDDSTFTFPEFSIFQNPNISSGKITLPQQADGARAGFYFYADTDFSKTDKMKDLAKLMGIPESTTFQAGLFVGVDPTSNSKLSFSVSSDIATGTSLTGTFGAQITNGDFGFFLQGTVDITIQGNDVQFDATILVVENGAFISGDMVVTGGTKSITFSIFQLHELAIQAGISFEGEPSLGFAAELDVSDIDASIAVFIDATDVEDNKSMFAGSISDISLKDIFEKLSGSHDPLPSSLDTVLSTIEIKGLPGFVCDDLAKYGPALDSYDLPALQAMFLAGGVTLPSDGKQILLVVGTKGEKWFVTDMATMTHYQLLANGTGIDVSLEAQFYCVPDQGTTIATVAFPQGFHIYGIFEFLIIKASLQVLIMPDLGIGIDVEIDKIVVGSEDLLSITGANGADGPKLILCTFTDENNSNPAFQKPQFLLSAGITLLGLETDVDIEISDDGLHFEIKETILNGDIFDLTADISDIDEMSAGGSVIVGITKIDVGPFGTLSVDTDVETSLDFGITNSTAYATGSFGFVLIGYDVKDFDFDMVISDLPFGDMKSVVEGRIKEFFDALFEDAPPWLKFVGNGLITGFETPFKVAEFLLDHYGFTASDWEEVGLLLKAADFSDEDILEILIEAFGVPDSDAKDFIDNVSDFTGGCGPTTWLRGLDSL